jgi:rubrerythrin
VDTDLAQGGPATAATSEVLDGLNDLLQLDHDAVGSYDVALEKLENQDYISQITGFRHDHERHIRDLNALITQFGGTPMNEPHRTGPLKKALQSLGAVGGDTGVLVAWRANELTVRAKYDSYAAKANRWPPEVKRLIDRNALDEERHFRWVAELLETMGIGSGGDREIGMIDAMRERRESMGHGRGFASAAQERLGDRWDSVSDRMQDATGPMQDRMEELRSNLESQVRGNPARTLLVALAAGFVVGRTLR